MSRFRRRLMGLAALRQATADDFVRVEYIENSNLAYIDTKFSISTNNGYSIDAVITISSAKQGYLIGKSNGNPYNASIGISANPYFRTYVNRTAVNYTEYTAELDKKYHLIGSPKELTVEYEDIDEETQETVTKSFTFENGGNYVNPRNLSIFNLIGYVNNSNAFYGRIYSFKLYNQNGNLVRDYIPMYRKSTKEYGLWDRVNEEFYTSPNGVKFTGGERVIADADDNLYYIKNYISSNNTVNAYITLRKFKNTDNVEFEIYKKQNADSWFGSRQGSPSRNLFALNAYGGGININWGQQSPTRIVNGIANGRKHKVRLWDREVFVNGTKVYTCGTNTFTTNTNVTLGKVDGITTASNCNWYYFKWWNVNKDLVYDLIPVQSVDSGLYGMFDKVNLQFHSSDGTAEFTGG